MFVFDLIETAKYGATSTQTLTVTCPGAVGCSVRKIVRNNPVVVVVPSVAIQEKDGWSYGMIVRLDVAPGHTRSLVRSSDCNCM